MSKLQALLLKNEQFHLVNDNTLSTTFECWDIQTKFSDHIMTVVQSLMCVADWNVSLWGAISSANIQDW